MDRRVKAAIDVIEHDCRRSVSVATLARMVGLSPWHFTHLFKAATSKPPLKYLQDVRMQKARAMLTRTTLSVKEIIYNVGLHDRSHFSREFKRLHGLTPKEFIAQHRAYNETHASRLRRAANSATQQQ